MFWKIKKFEELSPHELYAILQLRNEVFVVEQNCVYQDADNKDPGCRHMMGWEDDWLAAYTRILPPGPGSPIPSIGRVVVSPRIRKTGTGKLLMEKSIQAIENLFGKTPILIGAQLYLKDFYESIGFQQSSEVYTEDGIPHIEMIRP